MPQDVTGGSRVGCALKSEVCLRVLHPTKTHTKRQIEHHRPHPQGETRIGRPPRPGSPSLNQDRAVTFIGSAAISAWLTASHPNSDVKQVRAGVVLRWGTTREGPVLRFLFFFALVVLFISLPRVYIRSYTDGRRMSS